MKAKDLRIGNIVGMPTQDHGIDIIPISLWELKQISQGTKAEPIPLTEEWLVKLGFKDSILTANWLMMNKHDLIIDVGIKNKVVKCEIESSPIPCKYVHTLQNLYYALTQEELQINNEATI